LLQGKLAGGQVFITQGLFNKLTTEGQLAGVLGHEIGHVVGRHSAERIAKEDEKKGSPSRLGEP